jgi:hypothetical protein
MYATQFLTALILPQVLIETFGFKWTLVIAEFGWFCFFAANIYPTYLTMVPSSMLSGFANSIGWTCLTIYLSILAKQYASAAKITFLQSQALIFGWFASIFLTSKKSHKKLTLRRPVSLLRRL